MRVCASVGEAPAEDEGQLNNISIHHHEFIKLPIFSGEKGAWLRLTCFHWWTVQRTPLFLSFFSFMLLQRLSLHLQQVCSKGVETHFPTNQGFSWCHIRLVGACDGLVSVQKYQSGKS